MQLIDSKWFRRRYGPDGHCLVFVPGLVLWRADFVYIGCLGLNLRLTSRFEHKVNTQHTTNNTQNISHTTKHTTHNTQHTLITHTTHNTQHTTDNTQHTTHNRQLTHSAWLNATCGLLRLMALFKTLICFFS